MFDLNAFLHALVTAASAALTSELHTAVDAAVRPPVSMAQHAAPAVPDAARPADAARTT